MAADFAHHRNASPDGWTRQIHIVVAVSEPDFWNLHSALIADLLAFLTTDLWRVEFVKGGYMPAVPEPPTQLNENCVVLLSGGLDSLIGAIDLSASGQKPMAVQPSCARRCRKSESLCKPDRCERQSPIDPTQPHEFFPLRRPRRPSVLAHLPFSLTAC